MNPVWPMFDFMVQATLNFFIFLFVLRVLLECLHANPYNPIMRMVQQITTPFLRPFRPLTPWMRTFHWGALIGAIACQLIEVILSDWLEGRPFSAYSVSVIACGELLSLLVYIFIFSIIIQIILGWAAPKQYHPLNEILARITNPLLIPARRMIPPINEIDVSPIVVLIALGTIHILTQWVIVIGDTSI